LLKDTSITRIVVEHKDRLTRFGAHYIETLMEAQGRAEESEPVFSGRRVKRGMYKASDKRKINADVNGSYNIMRKGSPNVFRNNGVEGAAVHPVRLAV
jgi:hypothetical protein